jgi:hypothetical protein
MSETHKPQQPQQQQPVPQGTDRAPTPGFDLNTQQPTTAEPKRPFADWASI